MAESNSNLIHNQHGNCELKPCPFCGGEARRYYGYHDMYGITCKKCSCKIYGYANKASATRAWNKRTQKERGRER